MEKTDRRIFRYLLAFLGGVGCTILIGLIFLRIRHAPANLTPEESPTIRNDAPQEVAPRPQTFKRLPRPIVVPSPEPPSPIAETPSSSSEAPGPDTDELKESPHVIPVVDHVRSFAGPLGGSLPDTGRLSGKVTLSGQPPAEKRLPLDPICGAKAEKLHGPTTTRLYVVGKDHALADVIVSLQGIQPGTWGPSHKTNIIVQQACAFEPYISAAQAGQTVLIQNRDDATDFIGFESKENGKLHELLYRYASLSFTLAHPENEIRLHHDSHYWQFAYVTVFDHPFFAVSDKNGDFVIPNIPPGRYIVQARHRKAGVVSQEINVEANRNTAIQFVLAVPGTQTASAP